jgi:hypothetical protein
MYSYSLSLYRSNVIHIQLRSSVLHLHISCNTFPEVLSSSFALRRSQYEIQQFTFKKTLNILRQDLITMEPIRLFAVPSVGSEIRSSKSISGLELNLNSDD